MKSNNFPLHVVCFGAGPKANVSERKAAMSTGQQFIKDKGYSNKTQVESSEQNHRINCSQNKKHMIKYPILF